MCARINNFNIVIQYIIIVNNRSRFRLKFLLDCEIFELTIRFFCASFFYDTKTAQQENIFYVCELVKLIVFRS